MTTMHLVPIAPAPPRTPSKIAGGSSTLLTLSPAARCVLLPLQSQQQAQVECLSSPTEISSSVKRLQSLQMASMGQTHSGNCKKKIKFGGLSYTLPKPQSAAVVRRNERERNRVRKVNVGFAKLRDHVPAGGKNKKLSKVETLRGAVEYIKQLQEMLLSDGATMDNICVGSSGLDGEGNSDNSGSSRLGSVGSVCSTSDTMSVVDSVCSPSSIDTTGQSPEHYSTDSPSPTPSSAGPISPEEQETDFFDFTAWLVQS